MYHLCEFTVKHLMMNTWSLGWWAKLAIGKWNWTYNCQERRQTGICWHLGLCVSAPVVESFCGILAAASLLPPKKSHRVLLFDPYFPETYREGDAKSRISIHKHLTPGEKQKCYTSPKLKCPLHHILCVCVCVCVWFIVIFFLGKRKWASS